MAKETKRSPSQREILVVGGMCMALSAGLCLALSLSFGTDSVRRMDEIRTEMSILGIPETAAVAGRAGLSELDIAVAKPARMGQLVAELNSAEMELRMLRGIVMLVSMAAGLGLFLLLRELRIRPLGPSVSLRTAVANSHTSGSK